MLQGIDKASSKKQKLVASMVKMLTELGIQPMAERVEKAGEHETLKQLGFQLGQGFFYGRPSSIEDCAKKSEPIPVLEEAETTENTPVFDLAFDSNEKLLRSLKSVDWLLAQPEDYYTIQVLIAISKERALEHVAMQDDPSNFVIYSKQGKTRQLFIVAKGIFKDRASAKEASLKLANSDVSPWIRKLSRVHNEIRS